MYSGRKRQLLLDSVLLRGIPESELKQIESFIRLASFKRGKTIFRKGEPGRGMMMIVSGRVKITSPAGGNEAFLAVAGPGEVFGEIALLDGGPRTADAVALEDTELLVLDRRDFLPLVQRHPSAFLSLLEVLCARIRADTEMVEDFLFLDLPARLGRALRRLAEHNGTPVENGVRIDVRFSQRELGKTVGMTRESINKQLRIWRDRKILDIADGHIVILDMEALSADIEGRTTDDDDDK